MHVSSCRVYLIVQIVVEVVAQQQVDYSFLAVLVMPQDRSAVQSQQVTAAQNQTSLWEGTIQSETLTCSKQMRT